MGWNLTWYVPLVAVVLLSVVPFTFVDGVRWGRVLVSRWTWGLLLSPAAYFWLGATLSSIVTPVYFVIELPRLFDPRWAGIDYVHRYRNAVVATIALVAVVAVCMVVAWGSFPLDWEPDGEHLRLLPFIPLPSEAFLAL